MAKDPAINWYFDNWGGGTKGFSRHQKGCYMDLLESQFYLGPLSLEQVKNILGPDFNQWSLLVRKFGQDEQGNFFNERLELEKNKRRMYSESRANNRKKKDMNNISKSHVKHMKNTPETEIEIETETEFGFETLKGVQGETFEENWKAAFDEIWLEQLRMKYGLLDLPKELADFRFKCDSAPGEYHCRDRDGLRLGFLTQLKNQETKTAKQNGKHKAIPADID